MHFRVAVYSCYCLYDPDQMVQTWTPIQMFCCEVQVFNFVCMSECGLWCKQDGLVILVISGSHVLFITVLSLGWKHHCWILVTFLKGLRRHALTQDQLHRGQPWLWKPFGINLRNVIYFIAEEDTSLRFIQFVSFVNQWTLEIQIKSVGTSDFQEASHPTVST